jgi:hypothetical protein
VPVPDSRVSFHTTEWQPLPNEKILYPVSKDWFWNTDADADQPVSVHLAHLDVLLLKYSLSEDNASLTAEWTTPQFADDENQRRMKPFIKNERRVYEWKSGRFE